VRAITNEQAALLGPSRLLLTALALSAFHGRAGGADFAGDPASFLFESADRETGRGLTVKKILLNPLLEAATSFALRDVHEIVHEQFAVAPGLRANDDCMAEADATCVLGDNMGTPGRLGQFSAFGQRDAIDDQHSNALTIPDTGLARIRHLLRTERSAVGENEFFLGFRPLISDRQKLFEGFLIDHEAAGVNWGRARKEQKRCKVKRRKQFRMTRLRQGSGAVSE